jgi:hypothetical protein
MLLYYFYYYNTSKSFLRLHFCHMSIIHIPIRAYFYKFVYDKEHHFLFLCYSIVCELLLLRQIRYDKCQQNDPMQGPFLQNEACFFMFFWMGLKSSQVSIVIISLLFDKGIIFLINMWTSKNQLWISQGWNIS